MNFEDFLDIEYLRKTETALEAVMTVRDDMLQPFGYLHGGVTIALLETVASRGAFLNCGDRELPFGVDVHVAHRSSVRDGQVRAVVNLAREAPTSKGLRTQTWSVAALSDSGETVSEGEIIILLVPVS